jgi:hypothetical protein
VNQELLDHSPRTACAQAFLGQLPGMVTAGLPVLALVFGVRAAWGKLPLPQDALLTLFFGFVACAYWMAFRSVERTLDRLQDLGWSGLAGRRLRALAWTLPVGLLFMLAVPGLLLGQAVALKMVTGMNLFGLVVLWVLLVGPLTLVASAWLATYALLLRRYHDRGVFASLFGAVAAYLGAPFRLVGVLSGPDPEGPARDVGRHLDWLLLLAPVFHAVAAAVGGAGFLFMVDVLVSGPLVLVAGGWIWLATLHLQFELDVFIETYAWRECLREEVAQAR